MYAVPCADPIIPPELLVANISPLFLHFETIGAVPFPIRPPAMSELVISPLLIFEVNIPPSTVNSLKPIIPPAIFFADTFELLTQD